MRALVSYVVMISAAGVVCLIAHWEDWSELTSYAVLAAVGTPLGLALTIWTEPPPHPPRKRKPHSHVG